MLSNPVSISTGAKLTALKQKLRSGICKQRAEARQKKQELLALDNEEGFNDEEEAEMTDQSDTDDEEGNDQSEKMEKEREKEKAKVCI